MYIWCAVDLEDQLAEVRRTVEAVCADVGGENPALTLPLHISLKISCEVDDLRFEEAVRVISAHFSGIRPFEIATEGIERQGGILWIRHCESDELCDLHDWLVELFREEYGVMPHAFDLCFAYHSSLYVGDENKAIAIQERLSGMEIPDRLIADRFVIGCSESGKAGEYRVVLSSKFKMQGCRDVAQRHEGIE